MPVQDYHLREQGWKCNWICGDYELAGEVCKVSPMSPRANIFQTLFPLDNVSFDNSPKPFSNRQMSSRLTSHVDTRNDFKSYFYFEIYLSCNCLPLMLLK